jgi:hypothetical protein
VDEARRIAAMAELARLKRRLGEIAAIDFFGAQGHEPAEAALDALEARLARAANGGTVRAPEAAKPSREEYRRRVWVTRKNVHVDRIASAWLIRRFIDAEATFRFVAGREHRGAEGEVTFDMSDGTFTHVGDHCTFEVLVDAFALKDAGLKPIAEMVHNIDIKDAKFDRAEAPGFAALIAAIALTRHDDEQRIAFGAEILDALLELYRRRRGGAEET